MNRMSERARGAVWGATSFGIGCLIAACFMSFGFVFVGVIPGGAIAGASLAWGRGEFRWMLAAAIGTDLGVFLGGFIILMSAGVFVADGGLDHTIWFRLAGSYFMYIAGFAVLGGLISAATTSRLMALRTAVRAFSAGGAIGGGIILGAAVINVITPVLTFAGLAISFMVAGAICGASLNLSDEVSLSILDR